MPWSPTRPGGPFLTLVARLPELADALDPFLRELRLTAPSAHHYDRDQLHTTVLNLDAARGVPPEELTAAVSAALSGLGKLELEFGRPDVSRRSAYLTAVGAERLAEVRRDLRRRLRISPPRHAVATDRLAFCNVMRFGTAAPYQALASRLRAATPPSVRVVVNSAELVETDKVLSAGGTRVMARYPLSAPSREP